MVETHSKREIDFGMCDGEYSSFVIEEDKRLEVR